MTRDEARHVLLVYRPWTADEQAAEFAEALERVRSDPELARWFEQHCAAQSAIRSALKSVTLPEGLREQIVSERKSRMAASQRRVLRVAVACIFIVMAALMFWPGGAAESETSFAAYRGRMVRTALRSYDMELETGDPALIRAHLATNHCHADYVLPAPLTSATNTGCGALRWQGHRVSMICFRSGQPLPPGEKTDLFLFVMDRTAVDDAPPADKPQFNKVNRLTTASWTRDGMVYILAAPGGELFLKKFL